MKTTSPNPALTHERCQHRTPKGRQCASRILDPESNFCPRHAASQPPVLAGLRRRNGGLNLKSPGAAILLILLMGVACYGCASAAMNHDYGTPSGIYTLTVTATGGTVKYSIPITLTVR